MADGELSRQLASSQILDCNFDKDFCSWTQDTTDQKDWARQANGTATQGTGPSQDHTSGHGYYAYLETSTGFRGSSAQLISPKITVGTGKACLTFWYHMYGPHVADLNVYGPTNKIIWNRNGNQNNIWKQASVDVSAGSSFSM
ncbi:MAM and LDL-receptor class A domain-containing protein 1 [Aplysia californica]|uniref:MAM and LDL-receptor class A domain-containing protein 1 n=1 Tax=Aplysia californica TaxID=6500 RepID=A0ABM1VYX0_APLCA|nr:MAM and LDL-receptor class A domain-containing protein 1 [Aplysia californica]